MSDNDKNLEKLIDELNNAQPFLQQILARNVAGGVLPDNAIRKLLAALSEYNENSE